MNIKSKLSGHWTDEQLIEHLYGIGPDARHVDECSECRARLSSMVLARRAVEMNTAADEEVPSEVLAAQRRSIYAQIERIQSWPSWLNVRRWMAVGAMFVLVGGGAALYEQVRQQEAAQNRVTDAQLAQEVSQIASDIEPEPTAPLQALFDK
jgi:hypothetical protein